MLPPASAVGSSSPSSQSSSSDVDLMGDEIADDYYSVLGVVSLIFNSLQGW